MGNSIDIDVKAIENLKCLLTLHYITLYFERRKSGRLRFFDNSKTKLGFQSIDNRLTSVFAELDFDHYPHITDHSLRINLKKSLNLNKHDPILQNDERKVIRATQITTS